MQVSQIYSGMSKNGSFAQEDAHSSQQAVIEKEGSSTQISDIKSAMPPLADLESSLESV